MKNKILRKLCVYAVSASMILPASAPVMATTTTSVVRDYSFNLSEMNYTNAVLYEGASLQLRTTHPASVITLKKGNVEIAKCAVDVMPRLQFSTKTRTAKKGTTLKVFLPDAATSSSSSNSKVVKNMCNTCYADSHGNHYLKLKCQNKGTATITFQVYPKNTNKKVYVSKKIFRFKITVK